MSKRESPPQGTRGREEDLQTALSRGREKDLQTALSRGREKDLQTQSEDCTCTARNKDSCSDVWVPHLCEDNLDPQLDQGNEEVIRVTVLTFI